MPARDPDLPLQRLVLEAKREYEKGIPFLRTIAFRLSLLVRMDGIR